jgi:hypothetical protein
VYRSIGAGLGIGCGLGFMGAAWATYQDLCVIISGRRAFMLTMAFTFVIGARGWFNRAQRRGRAVTTCVFAAFRVVYAAFSTLNAAFSFFL